MSATAFILFLAIVALTLVITYFAAKQKRPMSFTRREGDLPAFKTDWLLREITCQRLLSSELPG